MAHEKGDEKQRQIDAWRAVQRGHAIANGMYVAAVNRVGKQDKIAFWGQSFVFGPQGELVAQADEETAIVCADIEPTRVEMIRNIWPFFRDRRIDLCGELTQRQIDE